MQFIDTHAHLDFPDFAGEVDAVLARAAAAGIQQIISIGTDLESSSRAIQLAETHDNIRAVVGWHPSHAAEAPADIRAELRALARHPKVAAIGETGLDYSRLPSATGGTPEADAADKSRQAALFEQQLEIAAELGLNCVIHQRASFDDTLRAVRRWQGQVRTVFHCFVENADAMRAVLDVGGLVSFTGIATFKNAQTIRDTIAATPLDRLMLETDCPFLAPVPYRGKRCEPAYVREIAQLVAATKGCTLEELSRATQQTAAAFFRNL